jgi:hypothetical protein
LEQTQRGGTRRHKEKTYEKRQKEKRNKENTEIMEDRNKQGKIDEERKTE